MPSSAFTSAELAALRGSGHTTKARLSVIPQTILATARINQASFDMPLLQLTVDNTSADWLTVTKKGLTVWIGRSAGTHNVGIYRVREDAGASTLYLQEVSSGDIGMLNQATLLPFADNDYISIIQDYNVFSVFPKIDFSGDPEARNATFYKDGDNAYTDQNQTTIPFIANIGSCMASQVDSQSGTVTISRTAQTQVFNGESVDTYAWDVGSNTIDDDTAQTVTITFTEGYHWYDCAITLDSGAVVTARRVIHAWGEESPPISVEVLSSLSMDEYTARATIRVRGGLGDLRNGSMAILHNVSKWGQVEGIDAGEGQLVGYLFRVSGSSQDVDQYEDFELITSFELLRNLRSFGQQLRVASIPSHWQEAIAGLMHLDFWIFYLLWYHTTLLTVSDFFTSGLDAYLNGGWLCSGGNFFQDLQTSGHRLNARIGQKADGSLHVVRNGVMMSQADRDALVTRITFTGTDIFSIRPSEEVRPIYGQCQASGFIYSDSGYTPKLARAYGLVGGQGAQVLILDNQLVTSVAELQERASNALAEANNSMPELTIVLHGNYPINAVEGYWVGIDLPEELSPSKAAMNIRALVKSVSHAYNAEAGYIQTTLSVQPETNGVAAPAQEKDIELPDDTANAPFVRGILPAMLPLRNNLLNFNPLTSVPYVPQRLLQRRHNVFAPPSAVQPIPNGIAWIENSLYKTGNATDATTTWDIAFIATGEGEEIVSAIHSAASPYLSGSTALWLFVLSNAALYYSNNALYSGSYAIRQEINSGVLLRRIQGISGGGGIAWLTQAVTVGATTYEDELTGGLGSKTHETDFYANAMISEDGDNPPFAGSEGFWQAGIGRTTGGAIRGERIEAVASGGQYRTMAAVIIDLGNETEVTEIRFWQRDTSDDGSDVGGGWVRVRYFDKDKVLVGGNPTVNYDAHTDWIQHAYTNTETGVRYVYVGFLRGVATGVIGSVYTMIDDIEIDYDAIAPAAVHTSDDFGVTPLSDGLELTSSAITYPCFDVDDWDLGAIAAGANIDLMYADDYDQTAPDTFAGLAGLTGTELATCVRIPRLKFNQASNNSLTALEFIYANDDGYIGRVVANFTSGVIASESDISITGYFVIGAEALETNGVNTLEIAAIVEPVGGGARRLYVSHDGGANWILEQTGINANRVRWVEGSSTNLTVSGDDNIWRSIDLGNALTDKTGNLNDTIGGAQFFI